GGARHRCKARGRQAGACDGKRSSRLAAAPLVAIRTTAGPGTGWPAGFLVPPGRVNASLYENCASGKKVFTNLLSNGRGRGAPPSVEDQAMHAADAVARTIVPTLRYRDLAAAIEWLCRAFGFKRHVVVNGMDGSVEYAELIFGDGMIMLGPVEDS